MYDAVDCAQLSFKVFKFLRLTDCAQTNSGNSGKLNRILSENAADICSFWTFT